MNGCYSILNYAYNKINTLFSYMYIEFDQENYVLAQESYVTKIMALSIVMHLIVYTL